MIGAVTASDASFRRFDMDAPYHGGPLLSRGGARTVLARPQTPILSTLLSFVKAHAGALTTLGHEPQLRHCQRVVDVDGQIVLDDKEYRFPDTIDLPHGS